MVKIQANTQGKVYHTSAGKVLLAQEGGRTPNIESLSVTPTTSSQTITATGNVDGYSPINVAAVTSAIDSNIVAGNIKKDVSILGVTGNYEGSGGGSKYGCTVDTFIGDVDANGVLKIPTSLGGNITFNGVKDVANYALYYKFHRGEYGDFEVSFPDLETISGVQALYDAFYMVNVTSISMPKLKTISSIYGASNCCSNCKKITEVSLPELTTISGQYGAGNMFYFCSNLTTVLLPKLQEVSGSNGMNSMFLGTKISTITFTALSNLSGASACGSMFGNCANISSIYFPALTTSSFGSNVNQFNNMFNSTTASTSGNVNVHFPSNLESTIQGLSGYPNFGGKSGYVTLSFDLPATS